MSTTRSLSLLGAIATMAAVPAVAADVDTSKWTCETCPYPKGTSGTVEVGLGAVSDASNKFGDYSGLQRRGAHLIAGGSVSRRGDDGYYADLSASDLGLDTRSISGRSGREGLYSLQLGYSEVPRHTSDGAATPFLGSGGDTLTLPAGYPAASTATMPLAGTLQPLELGTTTKRLNLGGTWIAGQNWSWRVSLRHDVRDGTKLGSGSFYATASQFALPVDQVTDQFEVSASYAARGLQATLGWQLSNFRNDHAGLTWSNPFFPVLAGASRGQLAGSPDNRFEQVTGSAGYDITPTIRASAEFAIGRMTQDAAFLAATLNPGLEATVPTLPAASLGGRADTFDGSLKISATPLEGLRLHASIGRDRRDNRTPVLSLPTVTTDMLLEPQSRSNTPFSITQDRFKAGADYRGPGTLRLSAGAEQDERMRTYQEVVKTRETTVWGRAGMQPRDDLSLSLKLAHGERRHSDYGVSTWFGYAENPLLRKYYLADRKRDSAGVRADVSFSEKVSLGLSADFANDDYDKSAIGLKSARSVNVGADLAYALSEQTQLHLYAQDESIRSRQAGSEAFRAPDWSAQNKDAFDVVGLGLRHAAIPDKLDIGGELTVSRSSSGITVDTVSSNALFPNAKTQLDSLKLHASYKLQENLTLTGGYAYERYTSQDWHQDGVLPDTVGNLLALGAQPAHYRVDVFRLALRYRF